MSAKLISKVEKAKNRSSSALNQFTETQERLTLENEKLDEVKSETQKEIEKHIQAVEELNDVVYEIDVEKEKNKKAIDGINFVINGNY